jgi:hypothetical protein
MVFVDGLRFDLAKQLEASLQQKGFVVEVKSSWAALPSVTATAKPAVTPVRQLISGADVNADFEPEVTATGQSLRGGYHLKKLLSDSDWQVLDRSQIGDPAGLAWTEIGDVDHAGHERGVHLAANLGKILSDVCDRITQLLTGGWKKVQVVTDHGWLLVPGGLPKTDLPSALSDNTWGRCAAIKAGASCDESLYPWYWNPDLSFALAPGVSCYRAGIEYTHGGLSLQECVIAFLTVAAAVGGGGSGSVQIKSVAWTGMRCKVTIAGPGTGLQLDIRTHPGNPSSSVTTSVRAFKVEGAASVVVEDDTLTDLDATIVILDSGGKMLAMHPTVIGGSGAETGG